jgi:ferritin-like metal-binding protein YciE
MDPRVRTPLAGLQQQYTLSKQLFDALIPVANAAAEAEKVKEQVSKLPAGTAQSNAAIGRLNAIVGEGGRRPRGGAPDSLVAMRAALQSLMGAFQEADVAPTTQAAAAVPELVNAAPAFVQKWQTFKQQDLPALNQQLKAANLSDATVSH